MAPRVCIVGAGVSGLRCATVLIENGFDVTIIEARERIGGRIVQSDQMGPLEVDLGANWVHSTGENPIIELANATKTPLHQWNEETLIVDAEGQLVESARANNALKVVWQILEEAMEYSESSTEKILPSSSLYDFFTKSCETMVQASTLSIEDVDLVLGMAEMWGAYVGTRVERQSLKFFFLEDCIGGDDCFIPSNYKNIMSRISDRPLRDANIRLGTIMTSVEAMQEPSGDPCKVRIKFRGCKEEIFDEVVITSPIGWLKLHKNAIQPLSGRISLAIDQISVGNLEKVLIEFPYAFWEHEKHKENVSFVHWLSPSYASKTNPDSWRLECVSFNAFPTEYRRNILLFYTYGDCSVHITSRIYGRTLAERSLFLQEFFEPYYSKLPNYNPDTCSPLRFLATEWSKDELAGYGCYSNFQVNMTEADNDVRAIRHGMPEHHIYFAGEHTAPFDGLGTVAGAYNSGEAVARRIVEASKGESKVLEA